MTTPTITYSDRLRKARVQAQLLQSELASELHISASTVSVIENGRQSPSFPLVVRWAQVCDVSLDWVARGDVPVQLATAADRLELELLQGSS